MAKLNFSLFMATVILALGMVFSSAHAADANNEDFAVWMETLKSEAINNGVSPLTVHAALDPVLLDDRVVEFDHKQPEGTVTFDHYSANIVSPKMVREGREAMQEYRTLLSEISNTYGVPANIIVALWGIESHYGQNPGRYQIIDSLVTLAYEGRRAAFFRAETINALKILDIDHIPSSALRGSWAGAMGQCQFMPSTFLRYAVDYDHNGHRDIWSSPADVFASMANYLAAEGWRPGMTWGQEVSFSDRVSSDMVGLDHAQPLAAWKELGLGDNSENPLQLPDVNLALIRPDGEDGKSFLVTDNYRAIMRWNRSTYFATAVGLLADQLQ